MPPSSKLIYSAHIGYPWYPYLSPTKTNMTQSRVVLSSNLTINKNRLKSPEISIVLDEISMSLGFPMIFLWFSYDLPWFSYGFPMIFPRCPMAPGAPLLFPRPTPPLVAPVSPAPHAQSTPQPELRVARQWVGDSWFSRNGGVHGNGGNPWIVMVSNG